MIDFGYVVQTEALEDVDCLGAMLRVVENDSIAIYMDGAAALKVADYRGRLFGASLHENRYADPVRYVSVLRFSETLRAYK